MRGVNDYDYDVYVASALDSVTASYDEPADDADMIDYYSFERLMLLIGNGIGNPNEARLAPEVGPCE